jgi:DNA sulfur modification protein DndC
LKAQANLFEDQRLSFETSIELTAQSLNAYGADYAHWAIAFSGGKDSSTVLSLVLDLFAQGKVERPKSITVLYADTRQELPPLHFAAMGMLAKARERGCTTKVVCAPMEHRFWPYILGRGVPSPNNGTLRWCTEAIKVKPMEVALEGLRREIGDSTSLLMLTGVRLGESAARDQRISVSCSKDGGECGQGWFQKMTVPPKNGLAGIDTLAPILHWRVCHVWDWLVQADVDLGYPTMAVAEAYSMTESIEAGDEPLATRTGCIGCPLVSTQDTALANLVKQSKWAYLAPLLEIRAIHDRARLLGNRLRMPGGETRKDGSYSKNQGRFGPIKLHVRLELLEAVIGIQERVNAAAIALGRPEISLINNAEELFIRCSIGDGVWPNKWTGNEPGGEEWIDEPLGDGWVQPLLFGEVA